MTRLVMVCLLAQLFLSGSQSQGQPPASKPQQLSPRSSSPSQPTNQAAMLAAIDNQISAVWKEYGIRPSSTATDGEWCRRVYLDLVGRLPSFEEVNRFVHDRDQRKRAELVDRLLFDTDHTGDYTRHWTDVWANLLVGRTGGFERNSLTSRAGLEQYLRDALAQNLPYQELVHSLLTAAGTNSPASEKFNGAVNFLTMKLAEQATLATSRSAQLFLGRQVQCTQCHNHPFNDWKQNQFWEFNSFFRQAVALRRFQPDSRDLRTVELTDQDFGGEGNTPADAEVYYEQRNGILKAAYPTFIDGTELSNRSGYLEDVNRRQELARLVVGSPLLAESLVNRMWGYFLGCGFTSPVDDMGPHNPASHPELLELLARAFESESFDLKSLQRWIVLSKPYSLSSRTNKSNVSDDPDLGEPPKFSRFYLRQMSPEQLYESMQVIIQGEPSAESRELVTPEKRRWLRQFSRALGNDEGGESSTFNGTIPQMLMMFNGQLVGAACDLDGDTQLARVAKSDDRFNDKVNQLFMASLARKPNSKELKLAKKLAQARLADAAEGQWNQDRKSPACCSGC